MDQGLPQQRPYAGLQQRLKAAGLRPTQQRVQLARLLFESARRHLTAEMLSQEAAAKGLKLPIGTVYNTLNAFARAGLLREVAVDGTRTWFDTHAGSHHHFVDEHGRLSDIDADAIEVRGLPEPPAGKKIASVEIVVRLTDA
jgi:Fur family iron response transcriptional regulator